MKSNRRLKLVKNETFKKYTYIFEALSQGRAVKSVFGDYWIAWVELDIEYLENKFNKKDIDLEKILNENYGVALLNGDRFGVNYNNFIRIAFGMESWDRFVSGVERLKDFIS